MNFQEFQQQVLTLDIFSKEKTIFNDRGDAYEAQDGFNGCVYCNGKFQILINGANVIDESLQRDNIQDAWAISQERAAAWQMVRGQWTDTWKEVAGK